MAKLEQRLRRVPDLNTVAYHQFKSPWAVGRRPDLRDRLKWQPDLES